MGGDTKNGSGQKIHIYTSIDDDLAISHHVHLYWPMETIRVNGRYFRIRQPTFKAIYVKRYNTTQQKKAEKRHEPSHPKYHFSFH